jgi:phosphoribosyl 1,2-cyclic phosphodiesterase
MNIQFLGVGGAFDYPFGNASALLDFQGKRILIDCGHAVFPTLARLELLDTIDYILITHLHDDHVGSLSTLLYYYHHFLQRSPFPILYPTPAFQDHLIEYLRFPMLDPEKYADFWPITHLTGAHYIDTKDRHVVGMQSFGYFFAEGDTVWAYSGDIGDGDFFFQKLRDQGVEEGTVFHDCIFFEGIGAHTHYQVLAPYQAYYTIYGYHHNPSHNPADNPIPLVYDQPELLAWQRSS